MRYIFHNPHYLWYKMKLGNVINQTKAMNKYEYLFDYLYNDKSKKVYVYLDNATFATSLNGALARLDTPFSKFIIWVVINKLNPFRFEVIKDIKKINADDIIMTFIHQNFANLSGTFDISREPIIDKFRKTKAFKVVNLSHYGYNAGMGSKNTEAAEIDLFVSENNLAKNSKFFQYYYNWYKKDVYVLPFVPQKRFRRIINFEDRRNKAIAIGSITFPMADKDFINFFKHDKLQPMRHEIYNNSKRLDKFIDSYISHISENRQSTSSDPKYRKAKSEKKHSVYLRKCKNSLNRLIRILIVASRILIHIVRKKRSIKLGSKERQYYKFDIVEKYNEYRMFVCPEEVIDLPGIGFVEGMACGCAYLGKIDPMYSDLGLVDKIHYIGYDGTIEDLISKIEYYQNNPAELEKIAERGHKFVKENFNEKIVCKKYFTYIKKLCVDKQRAQNTHT